MTRVLAAAAFIAMAMPARAAGATFYVDAGAAASSAPCTSPANACTTVMQAVVQARDAAFPGGDRIRVAAGAYHEALGLTAAADDGDTIAGAGNSAAGTVIDPALHEGAAVVLGSAVASGPGRLALEDVRVVVGSAGHASAVSVATGRTSLIGVAIEMRSPQNDAYAISALDGLVEVRDSDLSGSWAGGGLATAQDAQVAVFMNRTSMTAGPGQSVLALRRGTSAEIARSRLAARSGGSAITLSGATALVDASLLLGGARGVSVRGEAGRSGRATIRRTTLDQGLPGASDSGAFAVSAASPDGTPAAASLLDSIAVEGQEALGTTAVACRSSDVPLQTQATAAGFGVIDCPADAGNSSTPAAQLFANAAAGDYTLLPSAPAVDSGSAGELRPGEWPTDFEGNTRVLDGDFDCVARRDKGAFELTGHGNHAPVVSLSVPASGEVRQPLLVSGTADDDVESGTSFAWSFSDGRLRHGRRVHHSFARSGAASVTLSATDSHGCTGSSTTAIEILPDMTPPVLSAVASENPVFRVGRPARSAPHGALPRGTHFRYGLSERASVTIAVERREAGRWARVASIRRPSAKRGRHSTAFSGRIGGRALAAGSYRARLVARDGAGNRSAPRLAPFRIAR